MHLVFVILHLLIVEYPQPPGRMAECSFAIPTILYLPYLLPFSLCLWLFVPSVLHRTTPHSPISHRKCSTTSCCIWTIVCPEFVLLDGMNVNVSICKWCYIQSAILFQKSCLPSRLHSWIDAFLSKVGPWFLHKEEFNCFAIDAC